MKEQRVIRVLIAKPGLDGHDRRAKVLTLGLKDEGMEVIYSGLRQILEQIVQTAIEEDADVIGLSLLPGAHKSLFPEVVRLVKEKGMTDVLIIGGGIIPEGDIPFLQERGVHAIFGPGTSIKEIATYIRNNVKL